MAERKISTHRGGANKDYLETILDVSLAYLQSPSNATFDVQMVKQEFPVDLNLSIPGEGDTFEDVNGGIVLNDAWFNYDPTNLYFEDYTREQIEALTPAERSRLTLTPRYRIFLDYPMPYPAGGGSGKLTYLPYLDQDNSPTASQIYAMWNTPPFTARDNAFTGAFNYSIYNVGIDDFPEVGDDNSAYANIVLRFRCVFNTGNGPTVKYDSSNGEIDVRDLFPNANNF